MVFATLSVSMQSDLPGLSLILQHPPADIIKLWENSAFILLSIEHSDVGCGAGL